MILSYWSEGCSCSLQNVKSAVQNISDRPSLAMYGRPYFFFRYIVFHVNTRPPLFQIRTATNQYCPPYILQQLSAHGPKCFLLYVCTVSVLMLRHNGISILTMARYRLSDAGPGKMSKWSWRLSNSSLRPLINWNTSLAISKAQEVSHRSWMLDVDFETMTVIK